jgi:hypothetical protein
MYAIISLLLVVAISLLITRVATVILTASGMSREAARFQARSAFTGAGFTTNESEQVVSHPLRRRVIAVLMLLGNVGVVAAASSTILGFRGGALGHAKWRLLVLGVGLLALVLVSRSRRVERVMTALIAHVLGRFTDLTTRDVAGLLKLSGPYTVSELAVAETDWVAGRRLLDLGLRDEGAVVLGITREDGRYLGAPTGATTVHAGDVLLVYGRTDQVCELDDRRAGPAGDRAHAAAVARQEHEERSERSADRVG